MIETNITTAVKGKRGRKSKKELIAALNIKTSDIVGSNDNIPNSYNSENNVILNVSEIINIDIPSFCKILDPVLDLEPKTGIKKRGRKPKGGKIIQQIVQTENTFSDNPNVILHLKCSKKDLQNLNLSAIDSYTFNYKNELNYEVIGSKHINSVNSYYNSSQINDSDDLNNQQCENENDDDDDDTPDNTSITNNKKIWKKLKQLEYNLHINNVNKKSACFWDSCDFDNPAIYIPKYYINGTYHVYGHFCSPECGVAYLMNENIDSSTKFERYHLFNHIYSKIYDYKTNIKPSPNPHYMLDKFYGNLSIQEYRSLLRNERLFVIVDKPLIRILPELHDDNDEFILNNKLIPSNNNYNLKNRIQKKKKNVILNEHFGISNAIESE
jgi:hypothetical protein